MSSRHTPPPPEPDVDVLRAALSPGDILFERSAHGRGHHLSHAAGAGFVLRNTGRVVVAPFGHSEVGQPDFHSGLNFAAVWSAPVVFAGPGDCDSIERRAAAYGLLSRHVQADRLLDRIRAILSEVRAKDSPLLLTVSAP